LILNFKISDFGFQDSDFGFTLLRCSFDSTKRGRMRAQMEPVLAKWPFFVGDALMLGAAWFVYWESRLPMGPWQIGFVVICVAGGACLSIMPFLLEYRFAMRLAETRGLSTALEQLRKLEQIASQISGATGQWQTVQEHAGKVATLAQGITERMGAEAKAFTQFVERANDGERATLRLEVEKLRRAENEWLQVLVRVLDHVYALNMGALRSGQPTLIEQLGNFQNACRETARRVGLTPFVATPAEPFDTQRHQLIDGHEVPHNGGRVAETVATGYTFQGRLLRPALVRLENNGSTASASAPARMPG
jgi:molecular chaperone GrpE (heat shock protein)